MPKSTKTPEQKPKNAMNLPRVHADMAIADIVSLLPHSESLLGQYGLSCFHCEGNTYETLRQGVARHGFTDQDLEDLVRDLTTLSGESPRRPQTLHVTKEGAEGLWEVISDGRSEGILEIISDGPGKFCLELREEMPNDVLTFTHADIPQLKVIATSETLMHIGGSTIDKREGRFKLDTAKTSCGCGGSCKDGGCDCECKTPK